jgi:hypothetical protein
MTIRLGKSRPEQLDLGLGSLLHHTKNSITLPGSPREREDNGSGHDEPIDDPSADPI